VPSLKKLHGNRLEERARLVGKGAEVRKPTVLTRVDLIERLPPKQVCWSQVGSGLKLSSKSDTIRSMRSRASVITVTLVLVICLVCPVVEMFDHWDHTIQTGNDTEYTMVLLALCIGTVYSLARCIFKSPLVRSAAAFVSDLCARKPLPCFSCNSLAVIPFSPSPPSLALRI